MDKYNHIINKGILDIRVIAPLPPRHNGIQSSISPLPPRHNGVQSSIPPLPPRHNGVQSSIPPLPPRQEVYFKISFDNFAKYLSEIRNVSIHSIPVIATIYDEGIISCDEDVSLRLAFLKSIQNLKIKEIKFKLSESTFPLYNTIMDRINWKHDNVSFLEMTVDRYPNEVKDLRLEKARGKILLPEEKLLWQSDYTLCRLKDRIKPKVLEDTDKLKYVVRHYVDDLKKQYDFDKLTDFDKVWLTYHFIRDRDKLNISFAHEQTFIGADGLQHLRRSEENWESKPYGTYVRRKGVCEGQARLFRILLNNWDMQVDAITLNGMSPMGPHCWLGAVINNKLYYCCTTQSKLFDKTKFKPDGAEYYPKIYQTSFLDNEDKKNIERHIKSLRR